jgi:hypothetical protein
MAMDHVVANFTDSDQQTISFAPPSGDYDFIPGPELDDPVPWSIVDNLDGTLTIKLGGKTSGQFTVWIVETP